MVGGQLSLGAVVTSPPPPLVERAGSAMSHGGMGWGHGVGGRGGGGGMRYRRAHSADCKLAPRL